MNEHFTPQVVLDQWFFVCLFCFVVTEKQTKIRNYKDYQLKLFAMAKIKKKKR